MRFVMRGRDLAIAAAWTCACACGRGDFDRRPDASAVGGDGSPAVDAAAPDGCVVADSVADFSGTQGANGWTYGYVQAQAGGFQLFPSFGIDPNLSATGNAWHEVTGAGGYWTSLWADGGHPNGTNGNAGREPIAQIAVRRWTAAAAADLSVSITYAAENGGAMDVEVELDGVEQFMGNAGDPGTTQLGVTVEPGSNLDFTISAPGGVDVNGATQLTATLGCAP